jgi:hypothetical protein
MDLVAVPEVVARFDAFSDWRAAGGDAVDQTGRL